MIVPVAFVIIYLLIHFIIVCIIIRIQTAILNTGFTRRLYSVHVARPQGSGRHHSVPTARCLTRGVNAKPGR